MADDPVEDDIQKRIIFVLLKVFHMFTCVIGNMNDGNTDLVQSTLRDYSKEWEDFHEMLVPYFEQLSIVLKTMEGLQITHETLKQKGSQVIRIEYKDSWRKENIKMTDHRLVSKTDHAKLHGESKTIHPSYGFFTIPMAVLNCMTPSFLKTNFKSSKPKFVEQPKILKKSSELGHLPIEAPPEDSASKESPLQVRSSQEENDGSVSDAEEAAENFLESQDKAIEPASSSPSYLDDVFKSMELPKTAHHEVISNSEPNEMILQMKAEMEMEAETSDFKIKTANIRKDLESEAEKVETGRKNLHTPPLKDAENCDEGNEEFKKKLQKILKKNKEELEQKRRERAEKRQKMDDEFKELRQQQKQGFAVLLQCILLRQRFETKEDEWSDWIRMGFKKPIEILINQFASFQEELGGDPKRFSKLLETTPEEIQSEVFDLEGKLEASLNNLSDIFDNLAKVSDDFEDAIFIRILQKSACDIAEKIVGVLKVMEDSKYSKEWYKQLDDKFTKIRTSDIPGTEQLKSLCKSGGIEGLENLIFPKWERRSHVHIEEVSTDREEKEEGEEQDEEKEVLEDQRGKDWSNLEIVEADRSSIVNCESTPPNTVDVNVDYVSDKLDIAIENAERKMECAVNQFLEQSNFLPCVNNDGPSTYEKCGAESDGNQNPHPSNGDFEILEQSNRPEDVSNFEDRWKIWYEEIQLSDESSTVSRSRVIGEKETRGISYELMKKDDVGEMGERGISNEEVKVGSRNSSTDALKDKHFKNLDDCGNLEMDRSSETAEADQEETTGQSMNDQAAPISSNGNDSEHWSKKDCHAYLNSKHYPGNDGGQELEKLEHMEETSHVDDQGKKCCEGLSSNDDGSMVSTMQVKSWEDRHKSGLYHESLVEFEKQVLDDEEIIGLLSDMLRIIESEEHEAASMKEDVGGSSTQDKLEAEIGNGETLLLTEEEKVNVRRYSLCTSSNSPENQTPGHTQGRDRSSTDGVLIDTRSHSRGQRDSGNKQPFSTNTKSSTGLEEGSLHSIETKETKKPDDQSSIRSRLHSIYLSFEKSDKSPYKLKGGRYSMKIVEPEGNNSEIVKIWNRIVEGETRFLYRGEFMKLVNSKLETVLKDFEQVTDC